MQREKQRQHQNNQMSQGSYSFVACGVYISFTPFVKSNCDPALFWRLVMAMRPAVISPTGLVALTGPGDSRSSVVRFEVIRSDRIW